MNTIKQKNQGKQDSRRPLPVALPPYMHPQTFADWTGDTLGGVNQKLSDGRLPAYVHPISINTKDKSSASTRGRQRFVNVYLYMEQFKEKSVKDFSITTSNTWSEK